MGGGSSTVPGYVDPKRILFGTESQTIPGMFGSGSHTIQGTEGLFDKDLYKQFLQQAKTGLTPEQKAMIEGKSAGSQRSGEQALREQFASMGNTPVGAQVGAQTNLRSGLNKNLLSALLEGDTNAKQQGVGNIMSTLGLGMRGSGQQNQYNMGKYQIDKENEFSWGDALGGLLGAGGQIGSSLISKPK
jgi:hypothetical protein